MSGSIYTRGGDHGETSLVGGSRVRKNDVRVEAYGSIDEANAAVGHARAALEVAVDEEARIDRVLDLVQHRLFNCSSRLATPLGAESEHTPSLLPTDVAALEAEIDHLTSITGELTHFVLPGGCEASARLHMARTVIRRAERRILDLDAHEPVDAQVLAFVNRCSDLLFACARYMNRRHQGGDVYWDPDR